MEVGAIFALVAAVCFGGNQVFVKRGTSRTGESVSAVFVTVFVGMLLLLLVLLFTGEWGKIWSLSWQGFALLAASGIVHFVAGRFLNYSCVRLIGANKTGAILRTSLVYAVAFGIIFLNEPLTAFLILGVLCIGAGVTLISFEKEGKIAGIQGKGIVYGLIGGFCYGISGVLAKPAIAEISSPFAAVFVSYAAACLLLACFLFSKEQREPLTQLNRQSFNLLAISGVFVTVAQLLRYIAFSYSPVSVVAPLTGTNVLFVLLFSFLLNRKIEVFTWKVFAGIAATVAGTALLFA